MPKERARGVTRKQNRRNAPEVTGSVIDCTRSVTGEPQPDPLGYVEVGGVGGVRLKFRTEGLTEREAYGLRGTLPERYLPDAARVTRPEERNSADELLAFLTRVDISKCEYARKDVKPSNLGRMMAANEKRYRGETEDIKGSVTSNTYTIRSGQKKKKKKNFIAIGFRKLRKLLIKK